MNKLLHRYKIWQFSGNGSAERESSEPPATRQVQDLVALMALYDYRPFIETELAGTCSLPNGSSAKCRTTKISSEAVSLVYEAQSGVAPAKRDEIRAGAAVQINVDQIGAVRGVVAAKKAEALQVAVDADCRPMLRTKLTYMAAEHAMGLYDGSAQAKANPTRVEPTISKCSFIDHTGTVRRGVVINVSPADALIKARIVPPVKSRIVFRGAHQHAAEVTRAFEMGFAVKFLARISPQEFSAGIKFSDD